MIFRPGNGSIPSLPQHISTVGAGAVIEFNCKAITVKSWCWSCRLTRFPNMFPSNTKIKISFLLLFQSESQAILGQSYTWILKRRTYHVNPINTNWDTFYRFEASIFFFISRDVIESRLIICFCSLLAYPFSPRYRYKSSIYFICSKKHISCSYWSPENQLPQVPLSCVQLFTTPEHKNFVKHRRTSSFCPDHNIPVTSQCWYSIPVPPPTEPFLRFSCADIDTP